MADITLPNVPVTGDDEIPYERRYNDLLPEFQALGLDELLPINLDITSAVTTTLGALPEVLTFVPALVRRGCDQALNAALGVG